MLLRQSTSQVVRIGPFVDDTDFKTAEAGLTINVGDIHLSKDGAAFADKNSGGATADGSNGWYSMTLDATDTDTVGILEIEIVVSGALPVFKTYYVVEEAVYDAIYAASAVGPLEANDTGSGLTAIPWNSAWDAEVESEVDDALVARGLDHLVDQAVVGADVTDNSIVARLVSKEATADWDDYDNTTDSLQAIRDQGDSAWITATGFMLSTEDGSSFTAIPWNSSWDAEVQSEVNDALVALGLDHLVSTSVTGTDVADDSIIAMLVSKEATADWDDYNNTTESLQALRDRGDSAWITYAGDGSGFTAIPWNSSWDSEVQSECNDALVALGLDHLVGASVTGTDIVDDSIIAKLVSKEATADWDDFNNTTESLQALRDRGDSAWITATGFMLSTEDGSSFTAIPWNSSWDAEVQSECLDAMVGIGLDHLISASVAGADVADDSIIAQLVSKEATADWDDYVNTSDSLQAQRDNMGSPAGASIAADIATIDTEVGVIDGNVDTINTNVSTIASDLPNKITKNTALTNFSFVMIDSTDDISGKTGLTVAATRSIDGGAFANCANTPATEIGNGVYKIDLDASDLNGDVIVLRFTATGANDTILTLITQPT